MAKKVNQPLKDAYEAAVLDYTKKYPSYPAPKLISEDSNGIRVEFPVMGVDKKGDDVVLEYRRSGFQFRNLYNLMVAHNKDVKCASTFKKFHDNPHYWI